MHLSRRQRKYLNRRSIRQQKKENFIKEYDNFENLSSYYNLYLSSEQAARHVSWKLSVQKFNENGLIKTYNLHKKLLKGEDIRTGFITFPCFERGKIRIIRAVHFSERIVQKTLCREILYPVYTHYVIEDNYANQKYKGISYAMERFNRYLHNMIRENGRNGYILFIDFKNYFGSIPHDKLKEMYRTFFKDKKILHYLDLFVDAYGNIGLGLGSETSQLHGMMFGTKLDHFIKEKLQAKYYGRYMDDSYIIYKDKSELIKIKEAIIEKAKEFGITVNLKKTKIKDLKHGFTYLKTRYYITKTGKIIKRALRYNIAKERKKLIKLIKIDNLDTNTIYKYLNDWVGSTLKKNKNSRLSVWKIKQEIKELLKHRPS